MRRARSCSSLGCCCCFFLRSLTCLMAVVSRLFAVSALFCSSTMGSAVLSCSSPHLPRAFLPFGPPSAHLRSAVQLHPCPTWQHPMATAKPPYTRLRGACHAPSAQHQPPRAAPPASKPPSTLLPDRLPMAQPRSVTVRRDRSPPPPSSPHVQAPHTHLLDLQVNISKIFLRQRIGSYTPAPRYPLRVPAAFRAAR